MERQGFYYLYVNLNSLAELGFKLAAAKVFAELPAAAPAEELTQEEIDARVAASFENLDLSALDGLGVASPDEAPLDLEALSRQADQELAELEKMMSAARLSPGGEAPDDEQSGDDSDGEIDIDRYMARAYSYEEQLRERIDGHYQRADLTALNAALAQLPTHLSSLTEPMSAEDIREWLKLYDDGHEVLTDLTIHIRQLDTGS
jgi:hypothetical protein